MASHQKGGERSLSISMAKENSRSEWQREAVRQESTGRTWSRCWSPRKQCRPRWGQFAPLCCGSNLDSWCRSSSPAPPAKAMQTASDLSSSPASLRDASLSPSSIPVYLNYFFPKNMGCTHVNSELSDGPLGHVTATGIAVITHDHH